MVDLVGRVEITLLRMWRSSIVVLAMVALEACGGDRPALPTDGPGGRVDGSQAGGLDASLDGGEPLPAPEAGAVDAVGVDSADAAGEEVPADRQPEQEAGAAGDVSAIEAAVTDVAAEAAVPDAAAVLGIDPEMAYFGQIGVGMASPPRSFTVINGGATATGDLKVDISSIHFSVVGQTCEAAPLPPRGSCTVSVRFTPASQGDKKALLTVGPAGGPVVAASLYGSGLTDIGIGLQPAGLGFGSVPLGSSTEQSVSITNDGVAPGGPFATTLGGPNAAEFSVSRTTCDVPLPPGATCTVTVRFAPTSPGPKNASLVVTAPNGRAGQAPLSGSAI
jgi:hypothetical protein